MEGNSVDKKSPLVISSEFFDVHLNPTEEQQMHGQFEADERMNGTGAETAKKIRDQIIGPKA